MIELLKVPFDAVYMSHEIDQLVSAFLKAQGEMGPIKKSMQAHRHKYANIDAVLEEVLPILRAHQLSIWQPPISGNQDLLQTIITHSSGQFISFGALKIVHDPQDIQSYGGGITYTRRYALVSILGLPQEDDDGSNQKQVYETKKKETISDNHKQDIIARIKTKCSSQDEMMKLLEEIYAATKVRKLEDLTEAQYGFVLAKFLR